MVPQPPHLLSAEQPAKKNQRASEKTSCDLPSKQAAVQGQAPPLVCPESWDGKGSRHSAVHFLKLQSTQLFCGEQPQSLEQPRWPKVGKARGATGIQGFTEKVLRVGMGVESEGKRGRKNRAGQGRVETPASSEIIGGPGTRGWLTGKHGRFHS